MLKKMVTAMLTAAIILGTAVFAGGTNIASAKTTTQKVGGGTWTVSYTSGLTVTSKYYHNSKTHSASARVGSGRVVKDVEHASLTALARAYGVGTTYANWNTY